MNKLYSSLSAITLLIFLTASTSISNSSIEKLIHKRIKKEVNKVFSIEAFELQKIDFTLQANPFLLDHTLYRINTSKQAQGYAFVGKAPSKTDTFEYLVLFDNNFQIKKTAVLVYREDYGGEIASKRWLSQFMNKQDQLKFAYGDNINAISGATISVQSMTSSMNYVFSALKTRADSIN